MMFDFFRKSSCLPTSLIVAGAMLLSACGSKNQDKPEYVMRQIADEAAPRFVVAPKVESFSQDQVTVSFGIDELGEAVVLLTPKQQSLSLTPSDFFALNATENPYVVRSHLVGQQKKYVTFSKLKAGTHYQVLLVAQDELVNRQEKIVVLEFTTPSGPAEITFKNSPEEAKQGLPWSFKPELSQRRALVTLKDAPAWLKWDQRNFVLSGIPDAEAAAQGSFHFVLSIGDNYFYGEQLYRVPVHGDPLFSYAWHIKNTGQSNFAQLSGMRGIDINLDPVAELGLTGKGVKVRIYGSGLQIDHPDLKENIDLEDGASYDYRIPKKESSDGLDNPSPDGVDAEVGDVGTAQAGIIGAVGWNDIGTRGIAPEVKLGGHNILLNQQLVESYRVNLGIKDTDAAVNLLSFGNDLKSLKELPPQIKDGDDSDFVAALKGAVIERNAKFIKTAGEGDRKRFDANMDPYNNNPFMIVVGAVNAMGVKSTDAMAGANLWITAPGGEAGYQASQTEESNAKAFKSLEQDPDHLWRLRPEDFSPGLMTTDNTSCQKGFAKMSTFFQEPDFAIEPYVLAFSGAKSTGFNVGWQGDLNPNCDYTATLLQATAGSAAVVTGVVALMMQRNPFLTLRDVKHILALTARRVDENIAPQNIHVTDDSFVERIPAWTTNTAGYRFHNYYGFGLIDAAAAITMAGDVKNAGDYVPFLPPALDDPVAVEGVLEADNMIPENSASGLVEFGELSENSIGHLIVEAVQLRINISDDDTLSHYQIELRSPSGTKSVLLSGQNGGYWPVANIEDIVLMTNAFYGESAQGKWSMTIVDVKKPRYEQNDDGTWEKKSGPGALNSWGLKIYGYNAK